MALPSLTGTRERLAAVPRWQTERAAELMAAYGPALIVLTLPLEFTAKYIGQPLVRWIMVLVGAALAYLVFTGRGIYQINPAKQSIEIFRGADLESIGGSLLRTGDKLIAVSNLSVTAYDVGRATTAAR